MRHTLRGDALDGEVTVRLQMTCKTPVDFFLTMHLNLGDNYLCAHCEESGAEKDQELSRQYNVVLPVYAERLRKTKDIPKRNPLKYTVSYVQQKISNFLWCIDSVYSLMKHWNIVNLKTCPLFNRLLVTF